MVKTQLSSIQGSFKTYMFIVFLHLAAKSAACSKIAISGRDMVRIEALPFHSNAPHEIFEIISMLEM